MNNENVGAVLAQPEQEEYTLEELLAELDRPQPGQKFYTLEQMMAILDRR